MQADIPLEWNQIFEKELLEEIRNNAQLTILEPREAFINSGKNIRLFPIVIDGTLKVTREDDSGREILLYYLGKNESCAMTFSCCMQTTPSQVSISAEEKTRLLAIPSRKMEQWISEYPTWKTFMMNTIKDRFNELLGALDQVVFGDLGDRLINYLKEKSRISGSTIINLSHSQIARELATSREVISRLLKKLENDKQVILYRGQIKLMNEFFN